MTTAAALPQSAAHFLFLMIRLTNVGRSADSGCSKTPTAKRLRLNCKSEVQRDICVVVIRVALNVPVLDGTACGSFGSCSGGKRATSPEMEFSASNLPLQIKVPARRPTLPIGNSTGPANVTRCSSPCVHLAAAGSAGSTIFDLGSCTSREPAPAACASKRNARRVESVKVTVTAHRPAKLGACAWYNVVKQVCAAKSTPSANPVFTE